MGMNKTIALLTLALSMPAAALQVPADVAGSPVALKARDVAAQALLADRRLAAMVDGSQGALPDTKSMIDAVARSGAELAIAQKALDSVAAEIDSPRPDPFGQADLLMDAMQLAKSAVEAATPGGQRLAQSYDSLLARVREYSPYGDAAVSDVALQISEADLERALVELRKQAYELGYELRYRLNDTELGDRDLRAFDYDANMKAFGGNFSAAKRRIQDEKKGAPAAFVQKLDGIKDLAVFAQPRSA